MQPTLLRRLQLVNFIGQHRLGLERFLLDGRNQLLLLVNDLLELVHAFVVALLLMSALIVAIVDRFNVRVDLFDLIKRGPSLQGLKRIINHLAECSR